MYMQRPVANINHNILLLHHKKKVIYHSIKSLLSLLKKHLFLTYFIALVWIINGLFCKVLNFVPRHEQIVARVLGESHARLFTLLIGIAEVLMAVWILLRIKPAINATLQIVIVLTMNVIEFIYASDLLLWGKLNIIFALLFAVVIFNNAFILQRNLKMQRTS